MVSLAAKLAVVGICALFGNLAIGLFIYLLATIVFGVYRQTSGCSGLIIIPIIFFFGPVAALFTPRSGAIPSIGLMIFAGVAVAYDIGTFRRVIDRYNTTKEKAKVAQ